MEPKTVSPRRGRRSSLPRPSRDILLPVVSILVVLIPILVMRPRVLSYGGLQLLLNMAVPVTLVTLAQMFAMTVGEIDFSLGNLVSLVTCITGSVISRDPALGLALLAGILLLYMAVGVLLYLKKLPSIVVTIGLSFVWTGLAITIQPHPGGNIPQILQTLMNLRVPHVPVPVLYLALLAMAGFLLINKTGFGILIRGIGGNSKAVGQSGHSILRLQMMVFGLVGFFGILSGLALAGITTSADANLARNYTLLAVASVILGGGTFAGGKVRPVGAVLGACTMTLVGTLLTFLRISPDWQIGAQGLIILGVLFMNSLLKRTGRVNYV